MSIFAPAPLRLLVANLQGSNSLKLIWYRGPDLNRHDSHLPQDFKSCVSANSTTPAKLIKTYMRTLEAAPGFEPGDKGFADPCLTTWLCRLDIKLERKTRFELATPTLARWCSTTELLPQRIWLGYLDSNQRMTESKSVALPLGYSPLTKMKMGRLMGIEPTSAGFTVRCVNHFATTAIIKMAGAVGIEPTLEVLETSVLPLNYAPIINI